MGFAFELDDVAVMFRGSITAPCQAEQYLQAMVRLRQLGVTSIFL